MSLKDDFRKMIEGFTVRFSIPKISKIFFPPFYQGGQPKDAEFMAVRLEDGSAGISYVLLPDAKGEEYSALSPQEFTGKDPADFARAFGNEEPISNMISLAALNAMCQTVMKQADFPVDAATDSLGLLNVSPGDKVGMVGFFFPLIKKIKNVGAELVIIEKNENVIKKYPQLNVTLDPSALKPCNKVLCTSTTVLNDTLDEILSFCSTDTLVSIIGPTAGYFPDPLFARGVDIVGGRVVKDGAVFMQMLEERQRWGEATQKICFQKSTYPGIM
jgi:uncharacterized protein (DUF4213/DUF364 family)